MEEDNKYNDMQLIKREMYAMRNGIVADTLRKAGCNYRMIFGVNLPQLAEIALRHGDDRQLAEDLWKDTGTRESMMIAPMLMPADSFSLEDAHRWISSLASREVADVLCLKLLRKQPYSLDLAKILLESDDEMRHYVGLRLMCNLAPQHPQLAVQVGEKEKARADRSTFSLAEILTSYSEML